MCDCGDQPECETKDQDCPGPDLEEEPCVEVSPVGQLPVKFNQPEVIFYENKLILYLGNNLQR